MKKQMKQVAAATLAALCFGTVAIPTAVSAANITIITPTAVAGTTTYNIYEVFQVKNEGTTGNMQQLIDGASIIEEVAEYFQTKDATITDAEVAATNAANKTEAATAALLNSLASKIAAYLGGIASDSDAAQTLGRELLVELKNAGVTPTTDSTSDASVDVEVANAGYYLVTAESVDSDGEKVVSAVMLETSNATITITLKADKPTVDKKILEDGDARTEVVANTAGVGEKVTYLLESVVPDTSYYSNYTFTMKDTLSSGLTFDGTDSMTIWLEKSEPANNKFDDGVDVELELGTHYTVDPNGTDPNLVIDFITMLDLGSNDGTAGDEDYDGLTLYVEYTATVNAGADVTATGNPNEVYLTYSNNPNWDSDGDGFPDNVDPNPETPDDDIPNPDDPDDPLTPEDFPPTEDTPPVEVITYLTTVDVYKVDGTHKPLLPDTLPAGEYIGFTLYNADGSAAYELTVDATGVVNTVKHPAAGVTGDADVEAVIKKVQTAGSETPDTADDEYVAMLTFSGLTEGTYKLVETHVPAGYVKGADQEIVVTATFADEETSKAAPTWKYNGSTSNDFTVINTQGTNLPSTGGIGTTIFTIVGLTLMATAAGAFIIKRKVTAQ